MRWRQPAHRPLVDAIVDSFSQPPEQFRAALARFTPAQWRKTWFWLDASGLSLYLLQYAEETGLIDALNPATVAQLRCKLETNSERTADLLREFILLNSEFAKAGIVFTNLKGFTLAPHSCKRPELRLQLDLDFLVRSADLAVCRTILERHGYVLSAATSHTWEFKAEHHAGVDVSSPYSKTPYRSVELHVQLSGMDCNTAETNELLNRRVHISCGGQSIPALSPADQLISQALHILGHLRSATTRPAWLLEFGNNVRAHTNDPCFWFDVQQLSRRDPLIPVAVAVSMLLTRDLFGLAIPLSICNWAERSALPGIRAWLQHYGRRAVLADFPGTKLYLLLDRELVLTNALPPTARSPTLLPARRIPTLFRPQPDETTRIRLRRWWLQSRFVLFRLRFHISQGLVYAWELHRWIGQSALSSQECDTPQTLTKRKQVHDNSHAAAP